MLRSSLADHLTFEQLYARVRSLWSSALAHKEVPFDELYHAVASEAERHAPNHTPFFQVRFVDATQTDTASSSAAQVIEGSAGVVARPLPADSTSLSPFDLTLHVEHTDDCSLRLRAEYNSWLLLDSRVREMFEQMRLLVNQLVKDGAARQLLT